MKIIIKNRYKKCSGNRIENRVKFFGCGKMNYNIICKVLVKYECVGFDKYIGVV